MIPKVIHYIWFSDEPYPPLVQKCMDSWRKYLPDYEIKHWNCDNFNVYMNSWCSQAYEARKYAFVADYARLWILYNYGGIYLDSDVEITKSFNDLLDNHAFLGFFTRSDSLEAETIGSEPKQEMIGKLLQYYDGRNFKRDDGTYDVKILPEIIFEQFIKEGMSKEKIEQYVHDLHVYPPGYFLMSDDLFYLTYEEGTKYLSKAYSLHYGTGSWSNIDSKLYHLFKSNYLKHFWTICKIIRYPFSFKIWQFVVNLYRRMFWG